MDSIPLDENAASRDRLGTTTARLTVADLARVTASGLTVAVCLVQMAFWDRWAEHLVGRWRSGQLPPPRMPGWYDDAINETLIPLWNAVPITEVSRLALAAADAADLAIARVETPVAAAITAAGEGHLLRRYESREQLLDLIDQSVDS